MSSPLLIIGSVAIDTIRTHNAAFSDQLGGSATFAALAARHWAEPLLLSAIGEDFPPALLQKISQSGISTAHLTRDPKGKSFRWTGVYDATLGTRETIGFEMGVMSTAKLNPPAILSQVRFAMMATYDPDRQLEIINLLPSHTFIATDTIHAWIKFGRDALTRLYRQTHLITLNEEELTEYTGSSNRAEGVRQLFELGASYVIIKRGAEGSILYTRDGQSLSVPAFATTARDTTGAGDSYLGTLMATLNRYGRVDIDTLSEGMRLGSAVASRTVEAFGVDSLISATLPEIQARASRLKAEVLNGVNA
jgi:cytidine kinase